MNLLGYPSAAFKVASLAMVIVSTLIIPSASHLMASSSDPFSSKSKFVGTLQYGETSGNIAYKNPPKYRSLKFDGKKGDLIEVWVRSPNGDALAYVVDNGYRILGRNDDADDATTNSHIKLTLPGNLNPEITTYYVIFTEYYGANASFTVSLEGSSKTKNSVGPHRAKWPPVTGRWKDDLNGQQIEITVASTLGDTDQGKIVGKYATRGKNCRNPDGQGKAVPFQIDFEGDYSNGAVTGVIYWCTTRTDAGVTFTTGMSKGPIHLQESDDGMTLSGRFDGANGSESISFTRIP